MLKLKTESPFCANFEDLGVAKSCPDGEKCYVGKCKYFQSNIKNRVHIRPSAYGKCFLIVIMVFFSSSYKGGKKSDKSHKRLHGFNFFQADESRCS